MKYNVLLADNDGTLMDFDASERVALKEAMDRQGVRLDEAREKLYSEINARLWEAFERRETTQAALRVDSMMVAAEQRDQGSLIRPRARYVVAEEPSSP